MLQQDRLDAVGAQTCAACLNLSESGVAFGFNFIAMLLNARQVSGEQILVLSRVRQFGFGSYDGGNDPVRHVVSH